MPQDKDHLHIGALTSHDIALLKQVAYEAADVTVRRWITAIGLDPDEPLESQAAFAMLRRQAADPEFAADLEWVRRARLRSHGIVGKAIAAAVGLAVFSGAYTLWAGLKTKLGGLP